MTTAADGRTAAQRMLALPPLPAGCHTLGLDDDGEDICRIVVAPERCFLPPDLRGGARRFGLAAHLYALRRDGDQGIGDFTTLALAAAATARAGGVVVGINPLHALFADDRERASPYHPSDRRFLDPIYIDVANVCRISPATPAAAARCSATSARSPRSPPPPPSTTPASGTLKRAVLEACFAAFEQRDRR